MGQRAADLDDNAPPSAIGLTEQASVGVEDAHLVTGLEKPEISAKDSTEDIIRIEAELCKDISELCLVEYVFLFVPVINAFEAAGIILLPLLGVERTTYASDASLNFSSASGSLLPSPGDILEQAVECALDFVFARLAANPKNIVIVQLARQTYDSAGNIETNNAKRNAFYFR